MAIEEIKNLGNQTLLRKILNAVIDTVNNKLALKGGDSGQDFTARRFTGDESHALLHTIDQYLDLCEGFNRVDGSLYLNRTGATTQIETYYFNKGNGIFNDYADVVANSFTPFTGCHIIPDEGQDFKIGELICIEAKESKDIKQPDWRGRYAEKGENGIFGIVFEEKEQEKAIPEIGVNKFYSIACLGDDKVFCNGENGDIEYGDELCASSTPGVAMKFTGEYKDRNQVCGKAGRSHAFESDETVLIDTTKE